MWLIRIESWIEQRAVYSNYEVLPMKYDSQFIVESLEKVEKF